MTGQTLLDYMEMLNQELQLQSGEEDVTRGLLALNVSQDYFETEAARRGKTLLSGSSTVSTTASTETTAFPTGLMRVDRLQFIEDGEVKWDLDSVKRAGGPARRVRWPQIHPAGTNGKPRAYWTNGTNIYWYPTPDDTYTIRWHGLQRASDITAAGTFAYQDQCAFPIAAFATRVLKTGVDDDAGALGQLAIEMFGPVLDQMTRFDRDGASPLEYTRSHQE